MSGITTTPSIPTARTTRATARGAKRAASEMAETAPPPPPTKRQRTERKTCRPPKGPSTKKQARDLAKMGLAPPPPPPPPKKYTPLHLSKTWVLYDVHRPLPPSLQHHHMHFLLDKYARYERGAKRVVEVSTTRDAVRLNTTPSWLLGCEVVYARGHGPKAVGEKVPDMRRETDRYKYDF